jgi:glutathione S-transferase
MAPATLVTIPFSHYCEKARWALQRARVAFREEGHMPGAHMFAVRRRGMRRTCVPILVTSDNVIQESTEIVKYADARLPAARRLFPEDPALGADVARLEDDFDERLGPHGRRVFYLHLLPDRDLSLELMEHDVPAIERRAVGFMFPLLRGLMRRKMQIDAAGAARSLTIVKSVFEDVAARLADGRRYLAGDRFTAADLTFAALAAPCVAPEGYPVPLPALSRIPDEPRALIRSFRETPAGAFALRLYRDERNG